MLTRSNGNTLVEMLVIIGIIGVICGAALPHIDTRREDVHSAMRELVGQFRTARTQALTTGTHYALHMPAPGTLAVQRMQEAVDGTWEVVDVVQRVTLPAHLSFWMTPETMSPSLPENSP